jgi:hypothetical protein
MYLQNSIAPLITGDGTSTSFTLDVHALPDAAWIGGAPKDTPIALWGSVSISSNYQGITVTSASLSGNLLTVNLSGVLSAGDAVSLFAYFTFPLE